MKSYLSEIFMVLAGVCLLLVVSPFWASIVNIDYSLTDYLFSDFKEFPGFLLFSVFSPALIIVATFGITIAVNLGLISRRKYTQYCYAVSALTIIIILVGFIRFEKLSWIVISLPPMLLGAYLAQSRSVIP